MQEGILMKKLYGIMLCAFMFTSLRIDASEEVRNEVNKVRDAIASELIKARQNALQNNIAKEHDSLPLDNQIQEILTRNRNILLNMDKSFVQTGCAQANVADLRGTFDCSNLMARRTAIFTGHGLIKNSFSGALTVLEGDFIVESSTFHGDTLIQENTCITEGVSTISYKGCFLDHLSVRNKYNVIIELCDTIVTGNINFDSNYPGIVVIDEKTVLGGTVSNACIMSDSARRKSALVACIREMKITETESNRQSVATPQVEKVEETKKAESSFGAGLRKGFLDSKNSKK